MTPLTKSMTKTRRPDAPRQVVAGAKSFKVGPGNFGLYRLERHDRLDCWVACRIVRVHEDGLTLDWVTTTLPDNMPGRCLSAFGKFLVRPTLAQMRRHDPRKRLLNVALRHNLVIVLNPAQMASEPPPLCLVDPANDYQPVDVVRVASQLAVYDSGRFVHPAMPKPGRQRSATSMTVALEGRDKRRFDVPDILLRSSV